MNKSNAPQIMSLSVAELEKLLGELRGSLAPATYQLVEALLRTLHWVMSALEQKTASLARLRRLLALSPVQTLLQGRARTAAQIFSSGFAAAVTFFLFLASLQ